MKEPILREYTQEEYVADMKKLLAEKGLKEAVKTYLDLIDEDVCLTGYITHRTVQERLCDILFLLELNESEGK